MAEKKYNDGQFRLDTLRPRYSRNGKKPWDNLAKVQNLRKVMALARPGYDQIADFILKQILVFFRKETTGVVAQEVSSNNEAP